MGLPRYRYHYSGLNIACEWAIDEWAEFEGASDGPTDLTIRAGGTDLQEFPGDEVYEPEGVGRFFLRDEGQIVVARELDTDPELVNSFLTTVVWALFCYRRGLHLLHGSAISLRGQALAFSGCSGAGKSTLAASLSKRGYQTLCDDTCRLETIDERICLHPSTRRLKLWGDSMHAMGWRLDGHDLDIPEEEKVRLPMKGQAVIVPQPLAAVYVVSWGALSLRRLTGSEAVQAFLEAATYRPELLHSTARKNSFIQNAIQVVSQVPVYSLVRPKDFTALNNTIELLECHWRDEFPEKASNLR